MIRLPQSKSARILAALFILGLSVFLDSFFLEPNWICKTHYTIHGHVNQSLKIAHLTDLHTSQMGFRERSLLRALAKEKPDVIVITGDTLSPSGSYDDEAPLLNSLHAPLGVWLVRGNWENWRKLRNESEFYRRAGVNFLLNRSVPIRADVWLIGLDDPSFGQADWDKAAAGVAPGAYRIALFHSPLFFDESAGRFDLALAGHTHGGQVRIPFLPPLWLPAGIGPYKEGWFEKNGSRIYVSRGLGMTILPIRFFCRPELDFVTVEPMDK